MPIYEYKCQDCGVRFEILRPIKDADSPAPCKSCQGEHTKRALSVFFAQSGTQIIAGGNSSGCASCTSASCSTCSPN